jgi:hypothetical protein
VLFALIEFGGLIALGRGVQRGIVIHDLRTLPAPSWETPVRLPEIAPKPTPRLPFDR